MSGSPDDLDVITCEDAAAWDAWLGVNHGLRRGVWLKIAKKGSGVPSLTNDEAVDVGLCWGWISGHRRALDDTWFLQRYTPRRRGSNWSAVNVAKVEALTAAGRMRPPGLAEVAAARPTGAGRGLRPAALTWDRDPASPTAAWAITLVALELDT